MDRQAVAVERRQQPAEPGHRPVSQRRRTVASGPGDAGSEPADLLFGDHQRVESLVSEILCTAATLTDGIGGASKLLGMLLGQKARAEIAAGLLIAHDGEHDVARRLASLGRGAQDRAGHHRHAALHVEAAAAPYDAVDQLGGEGVLLPVLVGRCHDVHVTLQHKAGRFAATRQPGDKVGPARVLRQEHGRESGVPAVGRQGSQYTRPRFPADS